MSIIESHQRLEYLNSSKWVYIPGLSKGISARLGFSYENAITTASSVRLDLEQERLDVERVLESKNEILVLDSFRQHQLRPNTQQFWDYQSALAPVRGRISEIWDNELVHTSRDEFYWKINSPRSSHFEEIEDLRKISKKALRQLAFRLAVGHMQPYFGEENAVKLARKASANIARSVDLFNPEQSPDFIENPLPIKYWGLGGATFSAYILSGLHIEYGDNYSLKELGDRIGFFKYAVKAYCLTENTM